MISMQLGKVLVTGAGGLMGAYVVSELTGKAEVLGYPGTLCEKRRGGTYSDRKSWREFMCRSRDSDSANLAGSDFRSL